ncbi:MAG: glycosyltransferase [Dehalococcoidia bacterium]|nr:glycosyltransferase [Dehalococcoidia bacterium]
MARIGQVYVQSQPLSRFEALVGAERMRQLEERALQVRERLGARTVWNINSTASGGGVAEMLASLLGYVRDTGIDVRWAVIEGTPEFFSITKRLHHALHGSRGDGSPLGDVERAIYDLVMQENADELIRVVRPGDAVILHDPQTAGLAPRLIEHGAFVLWRCHIGDEHRNDDTERGWAFLLPYLAQVPISIFSRRAYVPGALDGEQTLIVPPSIDPFSAKSEFLDHATQRAILARAGLVGGPAAEGSVTFAGIDGTPRTVDRAAHVEREGAPPAWETPLVVQVSRWDPLKDPVGVMLGFADLPLEGLAAEAELVLAGPEVTGVTDDPEAGHVFEETLVRWRDLPDHVRRRVHLAALPMADTVENASIVNALQGHAAVVVQKSLREGFGLTVTEAMWKARPVVASATGGIQDQIEDGVHGLLVHDPRDLGAYTEALQRLLEDRRLAERLGEAAHERVRDRFLPLRHLEQYADLIECCLPDAG